MEQIQQKAPGHQKECLHSATVLPTHAHSLMLISNTLSYTLTITLPLTYAFSLTYTYFPSNMHSLSHCPSPSPVFTVMLMQLTCDSGLTYTHKHSLSHSAALTKLCKPHSPVILVWHTLTFTFHLSHTVMLTQLTCDSGLTYRR